MCCARCSTGGAGQRCRWKSCRRFVAIALVLDVVVHLHANDAAVGVEVDGAGEWGILAAGQEWRVVEEAQIAEGDDGEAFFVGTGVCHDGILRPVEVASPSQLRLATSVAKVVGGL